VFLVARDGSWQLPLAGSAAPPDVSEVVQDEVRIFSAQPGTYRVVVATNRDRNARPGPSWTILAGWTVSIP
jgi:hypothetical protein